jgi:ABC-type transporter Mla MlaB component
MADSLTLKLEGSIKGPWVDELQRAWSASLKALPGRPVKVDLAGVSFIDAEGRELLFRMKKAGAILQAASPFVRQVLDGQDGKSRKS